MLVDPVLGLSSLGTLARDLSVSTPLDPLLETAAEEALVAIHAASVSIGRLDADGRSVRVLINVGDLALAEERFPEDETYSIAQWSVMRQVMTAGITRTASVDSGDCDPSEAELLTSLGKGSSVSAAIRVDGSIWGEFYATRHLGQQPFTMDAVDYVDVLTSIVGAAITRSLRENELAHFAFHDVLTGALNRRGLDESAAHVFALLERTSRVVTSAALDINGLKQVNDQQGHARGDALIQAVAQALDAAFGSFPGSLVARVGGDEFIVLVPDLDPTLVIETVETLCQHATQGCGFGPVAGLSAGISSTVLTGRADATRTELLAAADRALYLAKEHPDSTAVVSQDLTGEVGADPDRIVVTARRTPTPELTRGHLPSQR
jgi:diguanylate cyclase (GGDEF)-like protein